MRNQIIENLTSKDAERVKRALQSMSGLSVQIYPSKIRVELNDKDTKVAFGMADEIADGESFNIVEKHHKKHGKIISKARMTRIGENKTSFNQFDRAVFSVCISEQDAGNYFTTPAIINRGLTGKIGEGADGLKIQKNQRAAILHSLTKLMSTIVYVDLREYCEKLEVQVDKPPVFVGPALPAQFIEAAVNGKDATMIYFPEGDAGESPLLKAAELKNQILRYDATLLDVPGQNNTPRIIEVKNYFMRRVVEIKKHKMTPVITFGDVFSKCKLTKLDCKIKQRAREALITFLEYLTSKEFLKNFELTKKGNAFHSAKLIF